jgi:S1-C subfamily serine protease
MSWDRLLAYHTVAYDDENAIGLGFAKKKGKIVVVSSTGQSLAKGVQKGDVILEINGRVRVGR